MCIFSRTQNTLCFCYAVFVPLIENDAVPSRNYTELRGTLRVTAAAAVDTASGTSYLAKWQPPLLARDKHVGSLKKIYARISVVVASGRDHSSKQPLNDSVTPPGLLPKHSLVNNRCDARVCRTLTGFLSLP